MKKAILGALLAFSGCNYDTSGYKYMYRASCFDVYSNNEQDIGDLEAWIGATKDTQYLDDDICKYAKNSVIVIEDETLIPSTLSPGLKNHGETLLMPDLSYVIRVDVNGGALLHEFFHVIDGMRDAKLNTGDHPGWDNNGYNALATHFWDNNSLQQVKYRNGR